MIVSFKTCDETDIQCLRFHIHHTKSNPFLHNVYVCVCANVDGCL